MHKLNKHGEAIMKEEEGLVLYAYDDRDPSWPRKKVQPGDKVRGVLTIGYGHTGSDVKPGMEITLAEAQKLLDADLKTFVRAMVVNIREHNSNPNDDIELTSNQFSALVSFIYNVGDPAFDKSTMYRFLVAGDINSAAGQFPRWCYDGGKKLKGLLRRRLKEQRLFLTPDGEEPDYSDIAQKVEAMF